MKISSCLIYFIPSFFDWCWSWNSNTLATWCEQLTHLKRPWCWERLKAGGEGDDREWDGWVASATQQNMSLCKLGDGEGQGDLVCCSPWGRKESDMTEQLNWSFFSENWEFICNWTLSIMWLLLYAKSVCKYVMLCSDAMGSNCLNTSIKHMLFVNGEIAFRNRNREKESIPLISSVSKMELSPPSLSLFSSCCLHFIQISTCSKFFKGELPSIPLDNCLECIGLGDVVKAQGKRRKAGMTCGDLIAASLNKDTSFGLEALAVEVVAPIGCSWLW